MTIETNRAKAGADAKVHYEVHRLRWDDSGADVCWTVCPCVNYSKAIQLYITNLTTRDEPTADGCMVHVGLPSLNQVMYPSSPGLYSIP